MDGMDEMDAIPERLESRTRHGQGLLIPVDTDEPHVRKLFQNSFGVTSHTKGAIKVNGVLALEGWGEKVENAGAHDRDVNGIAGNGIGRHEHPLPGMVCQQRLRPVSTTRGPGFRSGWTTWHRGSCVRGPGRTGAADHAITVRRRPPRSCRRRSPPGLRSTSPTRWRPTPRHG